MKSRAPVFILCTVILLFFPRGAKGQWVQTGGPGDGIVYALAVSGMNLFAGTASGVFLSENSGASWTAVNSGLPVNASVRCLGVSRPNLLANVSGHGIFFSSDNGANWTAGRIEPNFFVGTYSADAGIQCFAEIEPNLFAGTYSEGIFISADNGVSWKAVHSGWPDKTHVQALAVIGTSLFAGTNSGVYLTTDNGANWEAVNAGLPKRAAITCLVACGTYLFAGTRYGVYYSTELGARWTAVNSGLPKFRAWSKSPRDHWITFLAAIGSNLFAGNYRNGVFISRDKGTSWTAANLRFRAGTKISAISAIGTSLFAGTDRKIFSQDEGAVGGVFLSLDEGVRWQAVNSGLPGINVYDLAVSGRNIFASAGSDLCMHLRGFLSTDDGASWTAVDARFPGINGLSDFTEIGSNLFALSKGGVFISRDNGKGWKRITSRWPAKTRIEHLAVCGSTLFAAASFQVFQSDDYGAIWKEIRIGLTDTSADPRFRLCWIYDLAVIGENLFALAGNEGSGSVWVSTKEGARWGAFKEFPELIWAEELAVSGQDLLAGGMGGVYVISDNGKSAKIVHHELPGRHMVSCFAVSGTTVFAGTGSGVFFSTDNGASWMPINPGLYNTGILCLGLSGTHLFAGTQGGVWRLPLSTLPQKRR